MLQAGGNAFDAAVAVTAALAVVEPYSSGIGGGGFWLLHRSIDGRTLMVDGRERAPMAAQRDMYLDEKGRPRGRLSVDGALAAAIPGTPAALEHLARNYGRLPLEKSLAPAIRLAREGFEVSAIYRRMATFRRQALLASPASRQIFLSDGGVPPVGYRLHQPDLAGTLELIAAKGARQGFYEGELARRLVAGVAQAGGIWDLDDLRRYQVVEREPLRGEYKGLRIISAPPPSSGGVALLAALNVLGDFDLDSLAPARRVHVVVETMRLVYRDRAEHLGDPDHVQVPVERLTSDAHARALRGRIRLDRATPSSELSPVDVAPPAGTHTTHFSILDSEGNRVAATLSINYPFGSAFTVPGTGVLLNDEMDDFSMAPGVPNVYGLVGAEANAIAPGKRPLSSMSPTFVEADDRIGILGTPGGSRIISMVLLGILELERGLKPLAWVSSPRYHHQYLPDRIQHEPDAFSPKVQLELMELGHTLETLTAPYGNMQAVLWERGARRVLAASDPRGEGAAAVRDLGSVADR